MSCQDDSLQVILEDILSEYANSGLKIADSAVNEESKEMREIASKSAVILLERLKSRVTKELEASRRVEIEFEAAVFRTWKKPLDLLDLLLYLSLEVVREFDSINERGSSKNKYVQEALVGEQANACLVFNEIVHLLKSGFPSGAHAHWRTLHEIACVAYFISKHGEGLAKRFLDYEAVESYFQAQAIQGHQQKMECQMLSDGDFKEITKEFNKMKKRYGADFVKKTNYPFGWVPRSVLKTRSLKEIEKSVKLDVLRPFYDMAGYNVYGGSKGIMFKPKMVKKGKSVVVPVGPSNYGLADPGKSAAISLGQITACLLLADPSFKNMIVVEALRGLVDDICDAFCEIQTEFGKT